MSGKWPSAGVFGDTSNSPIGQFIADQIDSVGSADGNTGASTEIIASPIDALGDIGSDFSDPDPSNITPGFAIELSTVPALEIHSVPEPITLSLFGAGFIGAVLLHRRKRKLAEAADNTLSRLF